MQNAGGRIIFSNNSLFSFGTSTSNTDTFFIDTIAIPTVGSPNTVLAKFDTSGNVIWFQDFGWNGAEYCLAGTIDSFNNIYFCCQYSDSTIVGTDTLRNGNAYIAKYNEAGVYQWAQNIFSSNTIILSGIKADQQNNIYITGNFRGPGTNVTATFGSFTLHALSVQDAFLAKYSSDGTCVGVDQLATSSGEGVAVTNDNKPVIVGSFGSQLVTASGTIFSHGQDDACIVMHDIITGIETIERKAPNELFIYSNPTTGKCNITMPDEFLNKNGTLTLTLFDNNGKSIHSYPVNVRDGSIKLDLENEAAGIYIVTLTDGRKIYRGKIVFE